MKNIACLREVINGCTGNTTSTSEGHPQTHMQGNSVPGAYAVGGPEELGRGAALRIGSDSQFVQGIPNVSQTRTPNWPTPPLSTNSDVCPKI